MWEILSGLPPYGPAAKPFSATGFGTHSEGLVVRFQGAGGDWVGNFQRGHSSCEQVFLHPDGLHVVVVAGGLAYVVDAETQALTGHFGGTIEHVFVVPEKGMALFSNGLWFEALGPNGTLWKTRRISWESFRGVVLDGSVVRGEAESWDGSWTSFTVDVQTGQATGGSYNGPPM